MAGKWSDNDCARPEWEAQDDWLLHGRSGSARLPDEGTSA